MKANIGLYRWQNSHYPIMRGLFGRYWSDLKSGQGWQDFKLNWGEFPRIVRVKKSWRYL